MFALGRDMLVAFLSLITLISAVRDLPTVRFLWKVALQAVRNVAQCFDELSVQSG